LEPEVLQRAAKRALEAGQSLAIARTDAEKADEVDLRPSMSAIRDGAPTSRALADLGRVLLQTAYGLGADRPPDGGFGIDSGGVRLLWELLRDQCGASVGGIRLLLLRF